MPRALLPGARAPAAPPRPALLQVALAAGAWMEEAGPSSRPTLVQAILAAVALLRAAGPAQAVFVPVWTAYPALAFGPLEVLPGLRRDAVARLGLTTEAPWSMVFLALVAESARASLTACSRPPRPGRRCWPDAIRARAWARPLPRRCSTPS